MVKIRKVKKANPKRINPKVALAISALFLLAGGVGAYRLYYVPVDKANSHLKSISTPNEVSQLDSNEGQDPTDVLEQPELDSSSAAVEESLSDAEHASATETDFESVRRPTVEEILSVNRENVDSTESIKIDSIGLNLNIIRGTNHENMLFGATTMLESQEMGKGNYALAGHNMPRNDLLFSPLLSIEQGAKIILKGPNGEFKYQVVSTEIVDYREGGRVLKKSETPILTLVTCDKSSTTTNRFIVTAKLI